MKKISVIVPVYNVENELNSCVGSIIQQTYKEWELWLIDDGSTDRSPQICDDYAKKDSRIHVLHKSNGGVSSARNSGLDLASGEYVFFVDSDDCLEGNAVERIVEKAEDTNADIVMCGFFYRVVSDSSVVKNLPCCYFEGNNKELLERCFEDILKKELINPPWNKLIKTDIIQENNIRFNQEISILEDISFSIQVMEKCKRIVVLDEALYHYFFKQQGNLVHKFHANFFEALLFFDGCFQKYLLAAGEENDDISQHFFFQKTLAFLRKIYKESNYDYKKKYSELCRICGNERVQQCVQNYSGKGFSKKLVQFCIRRKIYWGLHILYLLT